MVQRSNTVKKRNDGKDIFFVLTMVCLFGLSSSLRATGGLGQNTTALFSQIDRGQEKHLAFLLELIRTSEKGEEAVQEKVAEKFRGLGCAVEVLKIRPSDLRLKNEFAAAQPSGMEERTSVVGSLKGSGNGRSILIFAHPDGDPLPKGPWRYAPFAGVTVDDRIFGWGADDDLAGVAIMAEAVEALQASGFRLQGDIYLCSTPAKRNAQGVIALLSKGYHADAALYLHPAESGAGMREIKAIASGMLTFQVAVTGKQPETNEPGKTAFAHLGVNAMDKTLVIINALRELDAERGRRVKHKALEAAVGRSSNILISHIRAGEANQLNRVPVSCLIGVSLTFPPNEKLAEVQKEVTDAIFAAAKKDSWLDEHPPQVDWLFGTQGVEVSEDHPLYRTVSRSVRTITGENPYVNPLHSASDIRNPILFSNIPCVGLGPLAGALDKTGFSDRWVEIKDYIRAIKVTALSILEWGKTSSLSGPSEQRLF